MEILAASVPDLHQASIVFRNGEAGVGDLVQQLREMASGADVETAEYMVQDIFEEYPFFAQYPVDKLRTTAALIGTMVAQGVLVGRSLFVALKMILECLQVLICHGQYLFRVVADTKQMGFQCACSAFVRSHISKWLNINSSPNVLPG